MEQNTEKSFFRKSPKTQEGKRSSAGVMLGLIGMVKPLLPVMLLAIFMGCVGNLMATFITILGGYGLLHVAGLYNGSSLTVIFVTVAVFALARGILRYAEQASNHYIAFKLLARIRHRVFAALRRLAPAKLDGSKKGNLIAIITSDIELLEVFYAHTISPIAIAVLTSVFMVVFLGRIHPLPGAVAALGYLLVGLAIPLANGHRGSGEGQQYRDSFGELNTCVLDNLYGLEETIQYGQQTRRSEQMAEATRRLEKISAWLKEQENTQRMVTDGVLLSAGVIMAAVGYFLAGRGEMEGAQVLIAVVAMVSSFGPTAALSALSNNLHHTLASGNRVLDLLEEEPVVYDVPEGADTCDGDICCDKVSFTYKAQGEGAAVAGKIANAEKSAAAETSAEGVLANYDAVFRRNRIHGIFGKSGCGKSTLLKLLMRFYETEAGSITYGERNVNGIQTKALRNHISYVTQETFLFGDTVENNIRIARENATREEVLEAAKKASIHDFIMSLPQGYDTKLAEAGASISGGEKQRLGLARAFLHNGDILLLDEPTSNIDSLNEGIILKSLEQEKANKTILLVSHRKSTMGIADEIHSL